MNHLQKIKFTLRESIFFISFILASLRATLFFPFYYIKTSLDPLGYAWIEIVLWAAVLFFALIHLSKENQIAQYLDVWRNSKILILFLVFAGLSIFWSISFSATLFRLLELFFATSLAIYFVTCYKWLNYFESLLRLGAPFVLINILFCILLPELGCPEGYPYYGAWRGIFWHKNQFGLFISFFNLLFLFFSFYYYHVYKIRSFFCGVFYVITFGLVVLSKSATAVIAVLFLSFAFLLLQIWLMIRHKMRAFHYYLLYIFSTIVLIGIYLNIDFLLGLLGKNTTLTGRSALWNYLVSIVIAKHPWFGYGFGAFWDIASYRMEISQKIGWDYQILIADNGFLDILVHLGIIGFIIFLFILIFSFLRAIKHFSNDIRHKLSFLPLFILIYILLANLSFSLFMETEVFVWMVVIQILCLHTETGIKNG